MYLHSEVMKMLLARGQVVRPSDGVGGNGRTTGGSYRCQLICCGGLRIGVRWPDGKMTYPCSKAMLYDMDMDTGEITWTVEGW